MITKDDYEIWTHAEDFEKYSRETNNFYAYRIYALMFSIGITLDMIHSWREDMYK